MSARQKRSNGGYGLRRKVAKKRLDEDFEYYFSKIGTPLESKVVKEEVEHDSSTTDDSKVRTHLVVVTEVVKSNNKGDAKTEESSEKRPRGRPRKVPEQEPDISESNLKFVDLKEKRSRKPKVLYIDENETSKAVDKICNKEQEVVTVAHEEIIDDEGCVVKHMKLEAVLADEITGLQEEEVSSLPEGEKENLPEDGVNIDSDSDERVIVQMDADVQGDSGEGECDGYEEGDDGDKVFGQKVKRKYRRNRLSHDTIRKLSQLSPDDKIECNECHKLLKPSSFRQHLRTHTGEKPFGCEVCDSRFTRKGDVERHVRIVHNKQKPFKCCRCQRAFGDKKNLRWHLMNHDKKLFHVCEVCGFKFGKREYWENHVRFIHPLPGGLDPSEIGENGDGDDQFHALTKTVLGEEETDVANHNGTTVKHLQHTEQVLTHGIPTDTSETISAVSHSVKQSGMKCVNVKGFNVASLVKIARPTGSGSSRFVIRNQADGIDAVVIHFNESGVASSTLHSLQEHVKDQQLPATSNLIRVVNTHDMLHLVESDASHQPIVIDTQSYGVSIDEREEKGIAHQVEEIPVDMCRNSAHIEYMEPEPGKVISIMLNEDQGTTGDSGESNSNIQTLIEVLPDAAKDDSQTDQNIVKSS